MAPIRGAHSPSAGQVLHGATYFGGVTNYGIIFEIGTNGSGYAVRHSFTTGNGNGPTGSLQFRDGTILYGMTTTGDGSLDGGVVFRINTDGSGYTKIFSFSGANGYYPHGSLLLNPATLTLYGMTSSGGGANLGLVFRINTSGGGYTNLHSFTGGASDGKSPRDNSLSLSGDGTTLYGMTPSGGASNLGVIFKINTSGSGYTNLHNFTGGDGQNPNGSLTLSGTTLYGMTDGGGQSNRGAIFKMNIDGSNYTVLHNFTGGISDGMQPSGSLTLINNMLYGATVWGGQSNKGVVFKMNVDGGSFSILHNFVGGTGDGSFPSGSLTLAGTRLYGTTSGGGAFNAGTIFCLSLPLPPKLTTTRSARNIVLSWPTNFDGFILQSSTSLVSPITWNSNLPTPIVINGQNAVTNLASDA